jgi:prepilin-type N-terminal cleavage/methylation domain-containing protein
MKLEKDNAGFTIIELIVTILVFGFVAAGLTEVFLSVTNVQRNAGYLQNATTAAQTEVESLRNNNYDQLPNGQNINFTSQLPSNLPAPRSGTVAISQPIAGVKRVDVTITYTQDGHTETVELSSLIGIIGISQ